MELELEEALRGVRVEIELTRLEPCETCGAAGGIGGQVAEPCLACHGRPVRVTLHRDRPVATRCGACGGTGWRLPPPCPGCGGRGHGRGRAGSRWRFRRVSTPERRSACGVRDTRRRRPGQRGDLIVITRVRPHSVFSRKGDHLHCEIPLTVPEAALGTRIQIPTPDGPVVVTIPAGTQAGQTLRVRGKGCPRLDREGRGDLLVQAQVMIPGTPTRRWRRCCRP